MPDGTRPGGLQILFTRKLRLKTEKRHGNYFIASSEGSKLARLYEKCGVSTARRGFDEFGDFERGGETSEPSRDAPIL